VDSIERWANYDGCSGLAPAGGDLDIVTNLAGAETAVSASDCPAEIAVELWTIRGGGHIPVFSQPAFADLLWSWLEAHPKP
jgi:poly(3-hydroxybutyrate) depolymerase